VKLPGHPIQTGQAAGASRALASRRKVVVTEIVGSPEGLDILPALSNFSVDPPRKMVTNLPKFVIKWYFIHPFIW
jgi:hypothetical protein